jgi:hypothetical protein
MNRILCGTLTLLLLWPDDALSQQRSRQKPNAQKETREAVPNEAVYFQDYYTFYDPRTGYTWWQNNQWITTRERPPFMQNVNVRKARVQILRDENLRDLTSDRFEWYQRQYPAQPVSPSVPVPIITITRDPR